MERLSILDGLRALAVIIVMVSHAGLGHIVPGGFGVTIFFVISGFLISYLLIIEREKKGFVHYGAFYLRRTVRIVPPLVLCYLATLLLVFSGLTSAQYNAPGAIWDFLLLTNYAPQLGESSGIPIPLWSLNIEEHFYMVFPFIFVAALGKSVRFAAVGLILLIAIALLIRVHEFNDGNVKQIYYWTHTRFDALLFGVLLALFVSTKSGGARDLRGNWIVFAISGFAIGLTLLHRDEFFRDTVRYTVQGIALAFVFAFLLSSRSRLFTKLLELKVLRQTADYSYVLYLIHTPLMNAARETLTFLPQPLQYASGIAASFAFAAAMHRYIEKPLLRWRKSVEAGMQSPPALRPKGLT